MGPVTLLYLAYTRGGVALSPASSYQEERLQFTESSVEAWSLNTYTRVNSVPVSIHRRCIMSDKLLFYQNARLRFVCVVLCNFLRRQSFPELTQGHQAK